RRKNASALHRRLHRHLCHQLFCAEVVHECDEARQSQGILYLLLHRGFPRRSLRLNADGKGRDPALCGAPPFFARTRHHHEGGESRFMNVRHLRWFAPFLALILLLAACTAPAVDEKPQFASEKHLDDHYVKHVIRQKEFGNISKEEYLRRAQELVTSEPGGDILVK